MRKLVYSLVAVGTLLSGCVAYPEAPYRSDPYYGSNAPYYGSQAPYYGDRSGYGYRDRDRDGVPNRQDRYPNDPRYY